MGSAKEEVVLLGFWISSPVNRVKIALMEKGIEFEFQEENYHLGKSPLLLEMNPVHKKIPVLIHNGRPICESLIILEYIDEVWDHKPPLLPSDPYLRSQARFWADYIDKKIYHPMRNMLLSNGEEQEAEKKILIEVLKVLEGQLGDKPYFGGETFGYLDATLISYYCWLNLCELYGNFSMEVECPKLVPWINKCLEREAVSNIFPSPKIVCEFISNLRKTMGIE